MSGILSTLSASFALIILTIVLGYLYINSNNHTRRLIAYSLYISYTLWSTYGVWEVTQSAKSILLWFLLCTIGFSFVMFVLVDNKLISTWLFYITILINLSLFGAGIALTMMGTVCKAELANDIEENDDNKSKSRFYIIFSLIIFFLLMEGYSTTAFVVFIIALTLNNHYQDLHIGDIMYCI
jgi:hypothetical protein